MPEQTVSRTTTLDGEALPAKPKARKPRQRNALSRAWTTWLQCIPEVDRAKVATIFDKENPEDVSFNIPYLKYDNIVILQQKGLHRPPLASILDSSDLRPYVPQLWEALGKELRVSHIGVTAPIPLALDGDGKYGYLKGSATNDSNVLRSPTSFQPLYGSFGHIGSYTPSLANETFWASATQHGVTQIWSPLHTMFSNGNISEKARVMGFESSRQTAAVDLYAGIGYFAMFYRKFVSDLILCWEINPWSVEGFSRGAAGNRWREETLMVRPDDSPAVPSSQQADEAAVQEMVNSRRGLIMFQESNERAAERLESVKGLPQIRHVNCGYLPSSSACWKTAVKLILRHRNHAPHSTVPEAPGWIHAHENIGIVDIESRTAEAVIHFQALVDDRIAELRQDCIVKAHVSCDQVSRVKTYAPGVMHCVLDIRIECRSLQP